MLTSYGLIASILFMIHLTLRSTYRNSVSRCFVWAAFWPLDVAICIRDWIRHAPKDGGDINNADLIRKMK
jgi:hypothetical protein